MKKVYFDCLGEHNTISGIERQGKATGSIRQGDMVTMENNVADAYISTGLCFEVVEGSTDDNIQAEIEIRKKRANIIDKKISIEKKQGTSSKQEIDEAQELSKKRKSDINGI